MSLHTLKSILQSVVMYDYFASQTRVCFATRPAFLSIDIKSNKWTLIPEYLRGNIDFSNDKITFLDGTDEHIEAKRNNSITHVENLSHTAHHLNNEIARTYPLPDAMTTQLSEMRETGLQRERQQRTMHSPADTKRFFENERNKLREEKILKEENKEKNNQLLDKIFSYSKKRKITEVETKNNNNAQQKTQKGRYKQGVRGNNTTYGGKNNAFYHCTKCGCLAQQGSHAC